MFYRLNENKEAVVIVIMYVDDMIIAGKPDEVEKFKAEFGSIFKTTEQGQLNKHLGVKYEWGEDMMRKFLMESIIEDYEKFIGENVTSAPTPANPGRFY